MAALTRGVRVRTRTPVAGEGEAIASLWRELWDAHEQWGGYPGSRSPAVYAQLARRLDEEARARAGRAILGGHVHLVADLGGEPCGQVEGWIEHNGIDTPVSLTCEVRSLIVGERARRFGVGRALLDALEKAVRGRFRGGDCVLAAEVLEPNPAHSFYERVGFAPVAWSGHIDAATVLAGPPPLAGFGARVASPDDALAIAHLEALLAERRFAAGDMRFPPPPPIEAGLLGSIAIKLADELPTSGGDQATIVVTDAFGLVRGAATVHVQTLEPPFVPLRRGLVGRFALDPTCPASALAGPLVSFGASLAASRGAARIELMDVTAPGTELHDAVMATGARPWSRVVTRRA